MARIVSLCSGGLDSSTLLYHLLAEGHQVRALGVLYGQRHLRELEAAEAICAGRGVEFKKVDLSALLPFLQGSALTTPELEVPEGHYREESMKVTVVPNRNMLFLAVALAWAIQLDYDGVAYAAHSGDHAIYPDCRPEFVGAMAAAAERTHFRPLQLVTPFLHWSKAEIVARGAELGVPFARTWSCYGGGGRHCGRCGTCYERAEAFQLAGVEDPTSYERPPLALREGEAG